jgi:hypothetical protein
VPRAGAAPRPPDPPVRTAQGVVRATPAGSHLFKGELR